MSAPGPNPVRVDPPGANPIRVDPPGPNPIRVDQYKTMHDLLQLQIDDISQNFEHDGDDGSGYWFSHENWPAWEYLYDRFPLVIDILRRYFSSCSLNDSSVEAEEEINDLCDAINSVMDGETTFYDRDLISMLEDIDNLVTDMEEEEEQARLEEEYRKNTKKRGRKAERRRGRKLA